MLLGNAINRTEQLSLGGASMIKSPLDTGHFMVGAGGLLAPTIRHYKGKFYIICTNFLEMKEPFEAQNFIIWTTDIWAGKWSDPIYIPFHGIDPNLFFDDDDRVYFQGCYAMDRTKQPSCTIKQFEIEVETGRRISEEREIWGGHARYDTEGPHIYKRGKWYYLLVAEGGTFEHHMLCISRSENIWGPYEDYERNPVLTADGTNEYIQNTGHGELLQDGSGQWWAVALGVRNEKGGEPLGRDTFVAPLGRESFLAPVEWPEGGWPSIGQPKMQFAAPPVRGSDGRAVAAAKIRAPPNVGNVFIRTPDLSRYHISDKGEGLALWPSLSDLSTPTGTSTFVGRRQRTLTAVANALLSIGNLNKGTSAGLALYKDHLRYASLTYEPSTRLVSLQVVTLDSATSISTGVPVASTAQQVRFKVVSSPTKWTFFAETRSDLAQGEESWIEMGSVQAWQMAAREMTGPMFGVFAHASDEGGLGGGVDFLRFEVQDEPQCKALL